MSDLEAAGRAAQVRAKRLAEETAWLLLRSRVLVDMNRSVRDTCGLQRALRQVQRIHVQANEEGRKASVAQR